MANKGNDNNFQTTRLVINNKVVESNKQQQSNTETSVVYINQHDVLVRTGSSHINGYIRSDDLDAESQTYAAEFFPYIGRLNAYFCNFD